MSFSSGLFGGGDIFGKSSSDASSNSNSGSNIFGSSTSASSKKTNTSLFGGGVSTSSGGLFGSSSSGGLFGGSTSQNTEENDMFGSAKKSHSEGGPSFGANATSGGMFGGGSLFGGTSSSWNADNENQQSENDDENEYEDEDEEEEEDSSGSSNSENEDNDSRYNDDDDDDDGDDDEDNYEQEAEEEEREEEGQEEEREGGYTESEGEEEQYEQEQEQEDEDEYHHEDHRELRRKPRTQSFTASLPPPAGSPPSKFGSASNTNTFGATSNSDTFGSNSSNNNNNSNAFGLSTNADNNSIQQQQKVGGGGGDSAGRGNIPSTDDRSSANEATFQPLGLTTRGQDSIMLEPKSGTLYYGSMSFLRSLQRGRGRTEPEDKTDLNFNNSNDNRNGSNPAKPTPTILHTFPMLPRFPSSMSESNDGLLAFETNASGTSVVAAGRNCVAVIRLPRTLRPRRNKETAVGSSELLCVAGTVRQGGRLVELAMVGHAGGWFAGSWDRGTVVRLGMRGALSHGQNDGTVLFSGQFSGLEGSFMLRYTPDNNNNNSNNNASIKNVGSLGPESFVSKQVWEGTCKLTSPGVAPQTLGFRMKVNESDGNGKVLCSLGQATVSLVHTTLYNRHASTISVVQALWHPNSARHLLVLSSDDVLRMYDTNADMEEPVLSINLSSTQTASHIVKICFVPHQGHFADAHKTVGGAPPVSCSIWRRLSVVALRANGQVLLVCPLSNSTLCRTFLSHKDALALVASLESQAQEYTNEGNENGGGGGMDISTRDKLITQLTWAKGVVRAHHNADVIDDAVDFLPEPQVMAVASREHNANNNKAVSLTICPAKQGAFLVLMRSWTDGTVDCLLCSCPVEARWIKDSTASYSQTEYDDEEEPIDSTLTFSDGNKQSPPMSPVWDAQHDGFDDNVIASPLPASSIVSQGFSTPPRVSGENSASTGKFSNLGDKILASLKKKHEASAQKLTLEESLDNQFDDASKFHTSSGFRALSSNKSVGSPPQSPLASRHNSPVATSSKDAYDSEFEQQQQLAVSTVSAVSVLARASQSAAVVGIDTAVCEFQSEVRNVAHVVCRLQVTGGQIDLVPDSVFPDVVMAVDRVTSAVHVIHLPWFEDLNKAIGTGQSEVFMSTHGIQQQQQPRTLDKFFEEVSWKLVARAAGPRLRGSAMSMSVVAEPELGHWAVTAACREGDDAGLPEFDCMDLNSETTRLRFDVHVPNLGAVSAVASKDNNNNNNNNNSSQTSTTKTPSDGLLQHARELSTALGKYKHVPESLKGVRLNANTNERMGMAVSEWLIKVSQQLLYDDGSNGNDGGAAGDARRSILGGLEDGYRRLSERRKEQDAALSHQFDLISAFSTDMNEMEVTRKDMRDTVSRLRQLQLATQESLDEAITRAKTLRGGGASVVNPQFASRLLRVAQRVKELQKKAVGSSCGLNGAVKDLVAAEKGLRGVENRSATSMGVSPILPAHKQAVGELQNATGVLLKQMGAPCTIGVEVEHLHKGSTALEGKGEEVKYSDDNNNAELSVERLKERVRALEEAIVPVLSVGVLDEQHVIIMAVQGEETSRLVDEIESVVNERQFSDTSSMSRVATTQLLIHPFLLSPEYQATVRRNLGVDATEVPFQTQLPTAMADDNTGAPVHLVMLDHDFGVQVTDGDCQDEDSEGITYGENKKRILVYHARPEHDSQSVDVDEWTSVVLLRVNNKSNGTEYGYVNVDAVGDSDDISSIVVCHTVADITAGVAAARRGALARVVL